MADAIEPKEDFKSLPNCLRMTARDKSSTPVVWQATA